MERSFGKWWIILALAFLAAALAFGVYWLREQAGRTGPRSHSAGPATASHADGPLPELKTVSQFAERIGKSPHPRAEPPSTPPLLRWDFSADKTIAYDYEQTVAGQTDFMLSNGSGPIKQSQTSSGTLLVKSKGDRTADVVFQGLKANAKIDVGKTEPEAMTSELPAMVIQGIKEDGSMAVADTEMELLVKVLFPIPPGPLKVGESIDLPGTMPFNAGGTRLHAKGTIRLTLVGYATVGGHRCACLHADIDISTLEVPKEVKGTYQLSTKGKSILYFDLEDGCFASAEQALVMSVRAEMPMPDFTVKGKKPPKDLPKVQKMAMDSDNLIRVTRRGK